MIETALFTLLKNLIPQEEGKDQIFFLRAPDKAKGPFIIIQRLDGDRWRSINGPSGMAQASFRIDCYSPGFYDLKAISNAVEETLDGYKGIVYHGNDSPQGYTRIAGISLTTETELLDETDDPLLYRHSATYLVTYEQ